MPDLLWEEVKNFFDPDLMGALPDVVVPGTAVEDWQAVLNLARRRGWRREYSEDGAPAALPSAEDMLSARARDAGAGLEVWPVPGVMVRFYPYSAEQVLFDVDLRQLQGQAGVDLLCGLLAEVGRELGKPVLMSPEGDWGHPVLGFHPSADRVVLLADPQLPGES